MDHSSPLLLTTGRKGSRLCVFERRMLTGSIFFALLNRDFEQTFGQIVSLREKNLSNKNLVVSRYIKREKGSLPVNVRHSKNVSALDCEQSLFSSKICKREYLSSEVARVARARDPKARIREKRETLKLFKNTKLKNKKFQRVNATAIRCK